MNPSASASPLPVPGQHLPALRQDRAMTAEELRGLVEIHEPDGAPRRLERSDGLYGEPLLPGFRLPVGDIFGLTP